LYRAGSYPEFSVNLPSYEYPPEARRDPNIVTKRINSSADQQDAGI
jgi:hypothetical protein